MKYYTPKIEEFVKGFKFEYYGDRIGNNTWHKGVFDDKFWTEKVILDRLNNYSIPLVRSIEYISV